MYTSTLDYWYKKGREKIPEQRKDGLTEQEGIVMDHLVEAWNEYLKLTKQHPSDLDDFCNGIHKMPICFNNENIKKRLPRGVSY